MFLAMLACAPSGIAQSIAVDLGNRSLLKLIGDISRPVVYGLNPGAVGQNAALISFDAANGSIMQEVTLTGKPTDMAWSAQEDAIYVVHFDNRITRVSLTNFAVSATKSFSPPANYPDGYQYDLAAGRPGRVYFTDAAWAPNIHVFDFVNGVELGLFNPNGDGVGGLTVTGDGKTLYWWRQYGWTAGVIGTYLAKVDCSTDALQSLQSSSSTAEREPFDTPILLPIEEDRPQKCQSRLL